MNVPDVPITHFMILWFKAKILIVFFFANMKHKHDKDWERVKSLLFWKKINTSFWMCSFCSLRLLKSFYAPWFDSEVSCVWPNRRCARWARSLQRESQWVGHHHRHHHPLSSLCVAPVDGAHTVGYAARCAHACKPVLLRLAGSKVDGKPTVSELCTLNLFWRNSIRKKTKRKTHSIKHNS